MHAPTTDAPAGAAKPHAGGTGHIVQSLLVNAAITAAKGVVAVLTGSGAMLAETLHTGADCGNQMLLLVGVRQSRRLPDARHPLGYGRTLYFWSFMVALILFTGGGAFSIYEGVHKLGEPEPVDNVGWAFVILGFSLALEGWSLLSNILEINQRRAGKRFFSYLRDAKDSDLIVVFGENAAAVAGLLLAGLALLATWKTGDTRFDAIGSIAVGTVLVVVAVFLAVEVQSLLVGEGADPEIAAAAEALALQDTRVEKVLETITVQQGPGEVLVAIKIRCEESLSVREVCDLINAYEERLRARCPEARWVFVEPDI